MVANAADIYDMHIRALPAAERMRLLALIAVDLASESVAAEERPQHSLLELRGLGKNAWAGVDAQEYVNRLRDEWHAPES